jgi:hypothetical protein
VESGAIFGLSLSLAAAKEIPRLTALSLLASLRHASGFKLIVNWELGNLSFSFLRLFFVFLFLFFSFSSPSNAHDTGRA